jgi:cyclopropane-fatty-acyl-phospholipid synthase
MAGLSRGSVAQSLQPLIDHLIGSGEHPVAIRWWDGTVTGSEDAATTLTITSPRALRHLLWHPGELGLARAYVAGDIDIDGEVFDVLALRDSIAPRSEHVDLGLGARGWLQVARAARKLGALGPPLPPPPEEARLRGALHSRTRDSQAISHHYDVSNDFYRLVLGPSMTYSGAYFPTEDAGLEEAQEAKHELISRKLGLEPGMRLLDVGCGWGGMVMHAARRHGVTAVGITLSRSQAELAEKRAVEAGLADPIEIRVQDYRDVPDGPFDAISSIGMFEHVGVKQLGAYFGALAGLLKPTGRLLNHAISRPSGKASFGRTSFVSRYVFPDGELQEVGTVVTGMQAHGLEVRDVHSLREHYARTLRYWVTNLEANWESAVELVGAARARVWRLYMAGSALGFEAGRLNLHQVLGVKASALGDSGLPPTRVGYA